MAGMSHLHIVPPAKPEPRQARIHRSKAELRQATQLQCNRCGSRTWLHLYNGGLVLGGRTYGATKIEHCVCAHCYQKGVVQPMLPEPPSLVKPSKPKRSKPRLVK